MENIEYTAKFKMSRIWNAILIIVLVLIIGAIIFAYFAFTTKARHMLREGKNVLLAFEMLSVEYYGDGSQVYDPTRYNGLAEGVDKRLEEITGNDGEAIITGYRPSTRTVTSFIYEHGYYRVSYRQDSQGMAHWDIDFIYPMLTYEAEAVTRAN